MGSAVETSKGPIRVDQTNDKGYATLLPARVVNESGEDKLCMLMSWCDRGHGNEDDDERDQRRPECNFRNEGQGFAIAVEEEAKYVRHLVGDEDMPWLDCTVNEVSVQE